MVLRGVAKKKKHIKECFTYITKVVKELQQEVRVDEKKKSILQK